MGQISKRYSRPKKKFPNSRAALRDIRANVPRARKKKVSRRAHTTRNWVFFFG